MKITSLSPEDRAKMREVTVPAFEKHIAEALGEDAAALLATLKEESTKANQSVYMAD